MNVLNATTHLKMVEMVNFMLHILYHSKKKLMTISPKKIIKSVKVTRIKSFEHVYKFPKI